MNEITTKQKAWFLAYIMIFVCIGLVALVRYKPITIVCGSYLLLVHLWLMFEPMYRDIKTGGKR